MPRYYVRTSYGFWRIVVFFWVLYLGLFLFSNVSALVPVVLVGMIVAAVFWLASRVIR
ncbi:hypothetical protein ThrDRAFT_02874 [Frankia casuarinae]|jgi:hypothetical protein|uniref:hypothetical protein n=1 Tax=Frankia TaxID=1854 RepID=UPI000053DC3A|nr:MULTISPECIES: hypothetical protein [Frankia]ETA01001.1 hypothetical protein CcI6DRAFT_03540 [Frankia sp. CcI6]EYT91445.1 hypothetical protein ThrDRAFT_02874 [Frankia casuarinae]KEZ37053.1 hypothetical protein CEDDRAFT_01580 [Frankia sp. CeD]KFB03437.1 hypothetical protein ALLO2DRAFT_03772 [Frankia sp. Allo2]OAA21979.1 hypothetical protein AAY23_10693 [Frankia casuarinae]